MVENLDLLKSIGFSKNEALIYLHLLDKTEGKTLEEITAGCKLTSSDIQEAIGKLVRNGAVKVVSNRFEAIAPKQVLAAVQREKERDAERKLDDARKTVSILQKSLGPLYWEKRLGIRPAEIIEPLEDLTAMELKTVRVIGNTENVVTIFAESFDWYEKIREELLRALDRGVKARVLMMVLDKGSVKRAEELKQLGVGVRHCVEEWYPVRGTLGDDKELVFLIWATKKKGVPHPVHHRPHYTTNAGLIKVFKDAFEKRWEAAKPV